MNNLNISIQSFQVPSSKIVVHSDLDGVSKKKIKLAEERAKYLVEEFEIEKNLGAILDSLNKYYYKDREYVVSLSVETRKRKHLALRLGKNQKQIISEYPLDCDIVLDSKYWVDRL